MSQKKVEKALRMELDMKAQSGQEQDPEFLEAQKRNRVISLKELLENAEQKGYLTKEECEDSST
jgi:hypothetical protein